MRSVFMGYRYVNFNGSGKEIWELRLSCMFWINIHNNQIRPKAFGAENTKFQNKEGNYEKNKDGKGVKMTKYNDTPLGTDDNVTNTACLTAVQAHCEWQ